MGLPISIVISMCLYFFYDSHESLLAEIEEILKNVGYSVASAILNMVSLICLNLALEVEEASKIAIIKTSDVVFSFILQYLILHASFERSSLFGAGFIMSATLLMTVLKIVEKKCGDNKPCLGRIMFYKF